MAMSRDEATEIAREICNESESIIDTQDAQLVVIVTDATGEWVGVASTVPHLRVLEILDAALNGADYRRHTVEETDQPTGGGGERG